MPAAAIVPPVGFRPPTGFGPPVSGLGPPAADPDRGVAVRGVAAGEDVGVCPDPAAARWGCVDLGATLDGAGTIDAGTDIAGSGGPVESENEQDAIYRQTRQARNLDL